MPSIEKFIRYKRDFEDARVVTENEVRDYIKLKTSDSVN